MQPGDYNEFAGIARDPNLAICREAAMRMAGIMNKIVGLSRVCNYEPIGGIVCARTCVMTAEDVDPVKSFEPDGRKAESPCLYFTEASAHVEAGDDAVTRLGIDVSDGHIPTLRELSGSDTDDGATDNWSDED